MASFTHLHCHSSHSLLDGLGNPNRWVKEAKRLGFQALALTDHASVSGIYDLFKTAKAEKITPIAGCEFYCTDDPERRAKKGQDREFYHLTVLAKNYNGLCSIFQQLTKANQQFYYKPLLSTEQIHDFKDCVVMTACALGVLKPEHKNFAARISMLKDVYDKDLYVEIQPHDFEIQAEVNRRAHIVCEMFDLKPVATNDCHYPTQEDTETQDVLMAVATNSSLSDPKRFSFLASGTRGLYLKTLKEMIDTFKPQLVAGVITPAFLSSAILSTCEIVEKCSGWDLPKLPYSIPPIFEDEEKTLTDLCMKRWDQVIKGKVRNVRPYIDRLKNELGVITKIPGVTRYFLLVYDIVSQAKARDILCGFGRGSVGGSLVAYLMGITNVDPVENELYFERFLRADRIDMPDIDLDFGAADREVVLKYIEEKYGAGNISRISTATEMHGKLAFRDVCRVHDIPMTTVNFLSSRINNDLTFEENCARDHDLAEFRAKHPEIIHHASRLDGQIRAKGVHAAGVIINEGGFGTRGVLERRKDGVAVNWTMDETDQFGLLKVDILGLTNLSVLKDMVRLVKQRIDIDIDLHSIQATDLDVFKQFSEGHTAGFFQFESTGITRLCQELAPIKTFEELVHINALYRPGPLDSGMVESYKRRKRLEEAIEYRHPKETEITGQTLGLPIFQEQIMAICVKLAGFSWPEADNVRKAIAKSKGIEAVEAYRVKFVEGCRTATPDLDPKTAEAMFDQIAKFGRYSFNKSHSACYSYIAYLTAWAKLHYPREFMAALLSSVTDEAEQTKNYRYECDRLGIEIELPEMNASEVGFSIEGSNIIPGFSSIKGVGDRAAQAIIESRKGGKFVSIEDFMARTPRRTVNKRIVFALAYAGVFRNAKPYRSVKWIVENYEILVAGKAPKEVHDEFDKKLIDTERMKYLPGLYGTEEIECSLKLAIDSDIMEGLRDEIQKCKNCALNKEDMPPAPFAYSTKSRILIVYDFPPRNDVTKRVEGLFRDVLGITPGRLLKANLFNCRPEYGRLPKDVKAKWECPKKHLEPLIKATAPEVILVMGNTVMEYFTGKDGGITKLNATMEWSPRYNAMLVFAVSPGSMFQSGKEETNEDLFKDALRKVGEYL